MTENEKVIQSVIKARQQGIKAAMATVVNVHGSAYRREGAKMLVDEHENRTGMISGGCLEADVAEAAKEVMYTGAPVLRRYHMDEDFVWGLGLGCPGTVDIYIEPVPPAPGNKQDSPDPSPFGRWLSFIADEKPCVLATGIDFAQSDSANVEKWRLWIPPEGDPVGSFETESAYNEVVSRSRKKLKEKNPKPETISVLAGGRRFSVFLDVYVPRSEIMIFGAGHDAIPVAHYALSLGWKTTVVDPRPSYNSGERFPGAKRIVADAAAWPETVHVTDRTYIIVMNHHIERDREALKFVLPSQVPYIGVLGPKKRRERMLQELRDEGVMFEKDTLKRMYSPIGLDIGSETSEEIAVSILAEIIAVRNGHSGGFLQDSNFIHSGSMNRLKKERI